MVEEGIYEFPTHFHLVCHIAHPFLVIGFCLVDAVIDFPDKIICYGHLTMANLEHWRYN